MTAPARRRRYRDPVLGAAVLCLLAPFALGLLGDPGTEPPVLLGFLVGLLPPLLYWSGYRAIGLVPIGLTVAAPASLYRLFADAPSAGSAVVLAVGGGLVLGAVLRYLCRGVRTRPAAERWLRPWHRSDVLAAGGLAVLAAGVWGWRAADPPSHLAAAPGLAVVGWGLLLAFAWVRLFRPFWELGTEPILGTMAKFRPVGPGLDRLPYSGPLLVLANHACWWDPLYLAKVLPRPITPMMTSAFFDIWFLRPLMVHVFKVIRVKETAVRRELPEVAEAIAALDRGECVVIFPEGWLRRKDEVPLRRFGRGVWEILKARPDTPVVPGWIEGGWGSWVSFKDGPPTKNKPIDIRRPIGVALSAPVTLKADVLADHLRTRIHLMNEVLAARHHLGLPPLPPVDLPVRGEDDPPA